MYSFQNLRRIAHPAGIIGAFNYFALKINQKYYSRVSSSDHVAILDEEWDNLLILDGCRYDIFEEQCNIEGHLRQVRSPASWTWGFLRENFEGRVLHDTIVITGNPYTIKLPEGTFHSVINLVADAWDDELQTVPPKTVADAVIHALSEYPNKRIIAHFMQPHYPFIGKTGQEIEQGGIGTTDTEARADDPDIWTKMQFGLTDATVDEVWTAYRENLNVVLDEVSRLVNDLPGLTVITTDHGNMVGERAWPIPVTVWGHPTNLHTPELVDIPWLVIDGERREVVAESPKARPRMDSGIIEKRLADLGYR